MPGYLDRFGGIGRLYGVEALEAFRRAHVCVIGLGGVGSWAAEALARSGVGQLTLVDMDDICVTNTNRQIHALNDTVGLLKADALKFRCEAISPEIRVRADIRFVTPGNVAEVMAPGFDVVIDAIDSVKSKVALLAWCRRNKQPVITTGGAGGLTDPTQIRVADLSRTYHDALLAKTRKQLRQQHGFPDNPKRRFGIEAVFSEEQPRYPDGQGGVCQNKPAPGESTRLDCASGYGAATMVTGTFGFVVASRALARLTAKI